MTARARRPRSPLSKGSKVLLALAALGFFGTGIYLGIQFAKPPPPPDFSGLPEAGEKPGAPEEEPETPPESLDEPFEIRRQPPSERHGRPKIALVIDDLGRSLEDLDTLASLGIPLTYSVLPFESRTEQVVAELRRRGVEILCHLPMEATNGADPGPGALLLSMDRREITAATRRALDAVPGAVGVNNHMGSGVSARRESITPVISVLAEKKLYFLDSRTSPDTLGYSVARHLGVPAAERQVFLDAAIDAEAIREQFARLLQLARERGGAIAIGHPHKLTLEVLPVEIRAAREQGFEFVTASTLLNGT